MWLGEGNVVASTGANAVPQKGHRLTNNELTRATHPPREPRFRPNSYPFTRASQISLIVAKDTAIALTRCRSGRDLRSIFLCQFVKPARHGAIEEILDGLAEIAARKRVDQLIKGVTYGRDVDASRCVANNGLIPGHTRSMEVEENPSSLFEDRETDPLRLARCRSVSGDL